MRCTARSKRTGSQCKKDSMKGREVCYFHGGRSLKGIEAANFKHGRYSKSIPDRLSQRYQEALKDEERHDLRDEIALSETKIDSLLDGIDRGESDTLWIQLRGMEQAMSRASEERRPVLLGEMIRLIKQGGSESMAWQDIDRWIARKQRAVETDVKVAQVKQEMVSAEEVMALVAGILDAIRRHVEDQAIRSALAREIRAIGSGAGETITLERARTN